MIGPGTGLAPFRGFIQERSYLKDEGKPVGESIFFFGCRKKAEDFIYQEELEGYIKKGVLTVSLGLSLEFFVQTKECNGNLSLIWYLIIIMSSLFNFSDACSIFKGPG